MAKLAVSSSVLEDLSSLPKHIAQKACDTIVKFEQQTHAGMHKERLNGSSNPRVQTIRVDQAYRGVVLAPESGDVFILLRVMHHDAAYAWIERRSFGINAVTGAIEVVDISQITETAEQLKSTSTSAGASDTAQPEPLFAAFSDKDLTDLGISPTSLPMVRLLTSDEQLLSLGELLPDTQRDVLLRLFDGATPEQVWSEIVGTDTGPVVDVDDFATALDRTVSSSSFHVVAGAEDLLDVLSKPFDVWRVFLHPTQRRIAYRPSYSGPARVTGGAGTGKTVVAMHRAKHLADTLPTDQPILFTTFTKNLTRVIENNLELLGGKALRTRITVNNADRLATQIVRDAEGAKPMILFADEERRIWREALDRAGSELSVEFIRQEWERVVLAQGLSTRDDYLRAARPGRGGRLDRRKRLEVWGVIEAFGSRQREIGKRTFLQMSHDAAGYVGARAVKPFRAVIVDEAQDLHPAQWRLLRALVEVGPNDMFIVGDAFQRIYGNRTTLSKVGIDIVGRSFKLRINYRTTDEILRWARAILDGVQADDLDGEPDTLDGYRSLLHGGLPRFTGCTSSAAETTHIVGWVRDLLGRGFDHESIGIAARTTATCDHIVAALRRAGIPVHLLDGNDDGPGHAVAVGTMHRLKGLEFRAVGVADCSRGSVPLPAAIVPENVDAREHDRSIQTERSLLFVACTRARDELSITWSGKPSEFLTATGIVD